MIEPVSRNLRPTAPQPVPEPGYTLVDPDLIDRICRAYGFEVLGVYMTIVHMAQSHEPCTIDALYESFPSGSHDDLFRCIQQLLVAELVTWVEESEMQGGAA